MASRINQMRNGLQPYPQTPQGQQQSALNESIARTRAIMQQIQNSQNPQAMLTQILQNNPNTAAISNMLRNGGDLESIARQLAQQRGVDINQLLNQLQGGL